MVPHAFLERMDSGWTKPTRITITSLVKTVTTHEAKTHLSRLVAEAEAGEEIIILRGSKPVARLTGIGPERLPKRPKVGTHTSKPVTAAPDAFAPLTDRELGGWGLS